MRSFHVIVPRKGRKPLRYHPQDAQSAIDTMRRLRARGFRPYAVTTSPHSDPERVTLAELETLTP